MQPTPQLSGQSPLDDVIATEELARRPARQPDHAAENRALTALARQLGADPHGVPQKLAELALALCDADSTGISLLEGEGDGRLFRWHAVAGRYAPALDGTVPYAESPCAPVVERNETMLLRDGARHFAVLRQDPPMVENLLVPWRADAGVLGTVWAISNRPDRAFDAEDARVLRSLADFAAAAYHAIMALDQYAAGQAELGRVALERTRVLEREVEQRHQAEEALRASEQEVRTLADTAPVLIWRSDEHADNTFVNQCFVDFAGRAVADLLGAGWQDLLHPDDARACIESYAQAVRTQNPWRRQIRVRRHDGQWRWVDAHAEPLFAPGGRYVGNVGAALDITESVQAGELLKDNDRRKDDFLAVLAHELRNPLAPISNAVHLLRHPGGRRRSDRIVEMLERQVRQIVRLVDDLLEISRITRDKIELELAPLPLAEAIHGALETSRPLIEQARHRLVLELPSEPLVVWADRVRLIQVLSNLVNNAARYTDPGGRIEVAAWREDGQAAVAVRDNGIGIPPDQLPRVFEIFTQAHRGSGRGHGGLGVGLAMVRSLVRLHGGSVEAKSAGPGRGSEFVVRLPLAQQQPEAAPPVIVMEAPLAGRRILVVDDNRDAADSLVMLLEADGAEAGVAYDGATALAALQGAAPDAVLLDLGMPGMDGYEVAHRIRADARLAGVALAALTGWGQEADRARTREAGFDLHLTKPVDLARLREWLGGAGAMPPHA